MTPWSRRNQRHQQLPCLLPSLRTGCQRPAAAAESSSRWSKKTCLKPTAVSSLAPQLQQEALRVKGIFFFFSYQITSQESGQTWSFSVLWLQCLICPHALAMRKEFLVTFNGSFLRVLRVNKHLLSAYEDTVHFILMLHTWAGRNTTCLLSVLLNWRLADIFWLGPPTVSIKCELTFKNGEISAGCRGSSL